MNRPMIIIVDTGWRGDSLSVSTKSFPRDQAERFRKPRSRLTLSDLHIVTSQSCLSATCGCDMIEGAGDNIHDS